MKTLAFFLFSFLIFNSGWSQTEIPNTLNKSEKVYGLSKFWQEVNYNFVFLNKIDREQWERDYMRLIDEVQKTENDYEYYRLLQKFCATLKDGHTNIYLPKSIDSLMYTTHFGEYRLYLTNIDGKAIITRVNASKKDEIPIGTEVIEVNGIPTQQFINEAVRPYLASSTDYVRENEAIRWLLRSFKGTQYDLTLKKPNGSIHALRVTHEKVSETEVYPALEERELLDFKWMDDQIAYLSLNSFGNPKIDTLFLKKLPELRKAKKLIIDLRHNGGGNTEIGSYILKYLTYDDALYGSVSKSRLHIPTFKAWGKWMDPKDTLQGSEADKHWVRQALLSYEDNYFHDFPYDPTEIDLSKEERLVIPTAILIGNRTASAAEDFLILADNQDHMVKIGQPSNGSTGQPLLFDLPGGGIARVCTKKDTYPDGREFVGYGIQPDIYVKKTVADFIAGRDPVLEAALEYLQGN